jgi:hypothetical protein
MKALSLTQPWATLVVIGAKLVETRSWSTKYTGTVAIHAAKKFTRDDKDYCTTRVFGDPLREAGYPSAEWLPTGAIIGTATIRGCRFTQDVEHQLSEQEQAFGNYDPGRFAWFLSDARRFPPIPCKGALGLWDVPHAIYEQIETIINADNTAMPAPPKGARGFQGYE